MAARNGSSRCSRRPNWLRYTAWERQTQLNSIADLPDCDQVLGRRHWGEFTQFYRILSYGPLPTVRLPSNTIGGSRTDLCEAGRVFSKNRLTDDPNRGQLNSGCSAIARQMEVP